MSTQSTFLASVCRCKDTEIGYDFEKFCQYTVITKINYIEIDGQPIKKKDWTAEDLASLLEAFFNADDCSELATEYLLTLKQVKPEFPDNPN